MRPYLRIPGYLARILFTALALSLLISLACGAGAIIVDEEIKLTDGKNYNHPSWSPDGGKLVYASDQGIWTMNRDGSGAVRLYNALSWTGDPVFDPAGTQIYYAAESKTAYSARYISLHAMNADGSENLKLTGTSDSREPSVSPDGNRIAYISKLSGNYDIWIMDISSRKSVQITDNKSDESSPSWSPDGTRLLYSLKGDIYILELDSSKTMRLTDDEFDNTEPAWSPDGTMITFSSDRDGSYDLWVMGADGKEIKKLTLEKSNEKAPAWSPDGNRIAYISNSDGEYNIWVLKFRVDDSEQTATVEYIAEENTGAPNHYTNSVRAFATEDPKKFIISILLISFVIVVGTVYSFIRKIR